VRALRSASQAGPPACRPHLRRRQRSSGCRSPVCCRDCLQRLLDGALAPCSLSPRAQHCCVTGSHSPSVQQVRPQTNSRLQQPLFVHACPAGQQPPPPACATGQHAPPTQAKPSGQQRAPQTREEGQQRLAWQDSHDSQHSMPQRMLLAQAAARRCCNGRVSRGERCCGGPRCHRRLRGSGRLLRGHALMALVRVCNPPGPTPLTQRAGVRVLQRARRLGGARPQRCRGARRPLRAVL
jgi:hypothetical protein